MAYIIVFCPKQLTHIFLFLCNSWLLLSADDPLSPVNQGILSVGVIMYVVVLALIVLDGFLLKETFSKGNVMKSIIPECKFVLSNFVNVFRICCV